MKQKETKSELESKINEETTFSQRFKHGIEKVIAGTTLVISLATTAIGCASVKHYVEPRVGVVIPVAAKKQAYPPCLTVGGAYGVNIGKVGLEAGLDCFHSSAEYIETNSILPRINVSYSPLKKTAKVKPYAMAGMNVLGESSTMDIPEFDIHDKVSNATFGLEGGGGVTFFDRIHARFSYTWLLASENVRGFFSLIASYRFGGR